jgi:hypothetical protein
MHYMMGCSDARLRGKAVSAAETSACIFPPCPLSLLTAARPLRHCTRLIRSKVVRKSIARVHTVYRQNIRTALRSKISNDAANKKGKVRLHTYLACCAWPCTGSCALVVLVVDEQRQQQTSSSSRSSNNSSRSTTTTATTSRSGCWWLHPVAFC